MWGTPHSEEEVARRRALLDEFYAQNTLPPLYRTSTMDPQSIRRGTSKGPGYISHRIYERASGFEVHTIEQGEVVDLARSAWRRRFGEDVPALPPSSPTVDVTIDGDLRQGHLLGENVQGWLISVSGERILILGTGPLPGALPLERVEAFEAE